MNQANKVLIISGKSETQAKLLRVFALTQLLDCLQFGAIACRDEFQLLLKRCRCERPRSALEEAWVRGEAFLEVGDLGR